MNGEWNHVIQNRIQKSQKLKNLSKPPSSTAASGRLRLVLLTLLFLAFGRLTFQLDAKNLWWDESLSLERAESDWWTLFIGRIVLWDGVNELPSVDQHPFGFFALLKLLISGAGISEFVLRFPSVMAATLMVAALYVMARLLARLGILPPATVWIAPLLAGLHPFYLWYGQEARMYTLVALLATLSTYLLLRWWQGGRDRLLLAYAGVIFLFLVTHYFAIFALPIHGLIFFLGMVRRNPRLAVGVPLFLGSGAAALTGLAAWLVLRQPESGRNFVPISLDILIPDLLNAYSLGLSVDITQVWWLDLIFGGLALLGVTWALWGRGRLVRGGWVVPAMLIGPVIFLLILNQFQPAYMNARHLSQISGFFVLMVAGGVAALWQAQRVVSGAALILLLAGMIYSTGNYFTDPRYGKDDFAGVGRYLAQELQPGDILVLNPPEQFRLYAYYLPIRAIEQAQADGVPIAWISEPTFPSRDGLVPVLEGRIDGAQRVWHVESAMYPFGDPQRVTLAWLQSNLMRIRERSFHSPNSTLRLDLFLAEPPVVADLPPQAIPVDVDFGGQIRLRGYEVGPALPQGMVPVTFYWQPLTAMDQRYKYRVEAVAQGQSFPATEREPYDGYLPTPLWPPDGLIRERSSLHVGSFAGEEAQMTLLWYNSDSFEQLPASRAEEEGRMGTIREEFTLELPLRVTRANLP